jgi:apolipoprotein N-acyltransferase
MHCGVRGSGGRATFAFRILLASVLYALAQPPWSLGLLAAVALVPWLLDAYSASPTRAALSGALLGTLSGLLVGQWIPPALVAMGSSRAGAHLLALVTALLVSGVPWGVVGFSWAWVLPRVQSTAIRVVLAATLVFVVESARSECSWGVPWALLGHSQWKLAGATQLAVVGGVPLISALLAATNASLAELVTRRSRGRLRALGVAAAVWGAYGALLVAGLPVAEALRSASSPRAGPVLDLLVVQPDLPPGERWERDARLANLALVTAQTKQALSSARDVDLILWPELQLTEPLEHDLGLRDALREAVDGLGIPLVLALTWGTQSPRARLCRNAAVWVEPGRGIAAVIEQTAPVPLLESASLPRVGGALLRALGSSRPVRLAERCETESARREDHGLAVLFGSEVVRPGLARQRRRERTEMLVNFANDAWFASTGRDQQIAYGAFRGVEERLFLVRVAHAGRSLAIDPFGRIATSRPLGRPGSFVVRVTTQRPPLLGERVAVSVLGAVGAAAAALGTLGIVGRIR